ncbi:MAG TPA: DUF6677 family protein [Candidatus Deferrimicrobium sp.]|nr:DUF6677 family protein [Candidatus Deferrimicrobium sp.]
MKPYYILILSWLFPGMGHIVQKKYLKGVVFMVGILLLLILGLIMQGKFYTTEQIHPLLLLGFLGNLGSGIFYFIIKLLGLGKGNIEAVTFQYGTTYLVVAGFINYLVALNAFDIAKGRRK